MANLLPTELLRMIFSYCNEKDLQAVRQVCHRWDDVAESVNSTIFKLSYTAREHSSPWFEAMRLVYVNKQLLLNMTRTYTGLSIEWDSGQTDREYVAFQKLLAVCRESFPLVQVLYLKAPSTDTLATLFQTNVPWMQNLVELHVKFVYGTSLSSCRQVCRLSLPKLKHLFWYEHDHFTSKLHWDERKTSSLIDQWHSFIVEAPKLRKLSVGLNTALNRNYLTSRLKKGPKGCCLFLPTLELVAYSNVQDVTLSGLSNLAQSHIDNCKDFLQKLKVLHINMCHGTVVERICEHCTNLKELTINTPCFFTPSIELFGTSAATLEKLTLWSIHNLAAPKKQFVFPNLHYLHMRFVSADAPWLIAPRLTTFLTIQTKHSQLIFPNVQQICTIKMEWSALKAFPHALPNLTALELNFDFAEEVFLTDSDHLKDYPKLKRLKLEGSVGGRPAPLDSMFVQRIRFYNLEYLHISSATLRLGDFHQLADITSLILSRCTIEVGLLIPYVLLPRINYFRVALVTVAGCCGDKGSFPIRTNERQVPIECDDPERNSFSSKNFDPPDVFP